MGLVGRPPKPTAIKELSGNPGKRKISKSEPKPATDNLVAPLHLSAEARAEWDRLVKQFADLKLITNIDADALAMYCDCYARWVEATKQLAIDGMVVYAANGLPMQSPYIAIINQSLKTMQRFLTEFGMTPASRTRLQVASEPEEDPFDAFVHNR